MDVTNSNKPLRMLNEAGVEEGDAGPRFLRASKTLLH